MGRKGGPALGAGVGETSVLGSLPLVFDFDDAWHLRYSRSPNPLVRWTLGKKLERMARRADFVIVANKFLQSWAEDAGAKSVTCIPTVVDLRRYPQTALPAAEPFTIGWIGTPETAPYLDTIKGALKQVLAREGTRLLLVGADPSFLPLPNVETQSWSEARKANLLQRRHVGIMPLPQGAWEYGKSGYKLVQYMAASRPVVASPVGVNRDVVKEGVNGFFAITEEEWIANLAFAAISVSPPLSERRHGKPWKSRSPCAPPCPRSPRSCCQRRPRGARAGASSRALPSNPIWRAPPRQTTPHHPDKQDKSRAGGRRGELDGVRRAGIEMLEQRIAGDDLARDPAEQRGPRPNDHRETFEQRNDDGRSRHDERDTDGKSEHQKRVASARSRGNGDDIVETHHHVGDGDDPDRLPQIVDGFDIPLAAILLPAKQFDGDPEEQDAADELDIGHGHQLRDHAGKHHPQGDGDQRAEHDAPHALSRRQLAASKSDDHGVVAG
jgi:Glycosyl transferases group 1